MLQEVLQQRHAARSACLLRQRVVVQGRRRHAGPAGCTSRVVLSPQNMIRPLPVPSTPEQQVQQATASVLAAWKAGAKLQRLDLLLPLIGATGKRARRHSLMHDMA